MDVPLGSQPIKELTSPRSFFFIMNTTLRYWFPDEQFARKISFRTYSQALKCIETFKKINVKSEVIV